MTSVCGYRFWKEQDWKTGDNGVQRRNSKRKYRSRHKLCRSLLLVQMSSGVKTMNNQMDKLTYLMEPDVSPLGYCTYCVMALGRRS